MSLIEEECYYVCIDIPTKRTEECASSEQAEECSASFPPNGTPVLEEHFNCTSHTTPHTTPQNTEQNTSFDTPRNTTCSTPHNKTHNKIYSTPHTTPHTAPHGTPHSNVSDVCTVSPISSALLPSQSCPPHVTSTPTQTQTLITDVPNTFDVSTLMEDGPLGVICVRSKEIEGNTGYEVKNCIQDSLKCEENNVKIDKNKESEKSNNKCNTEAAGCKKEKKENEMNLFRVKMKTITESQGSRSLIILIEKIDNDVSQESIIDFRKNYDDLYKIHENDSNTDSSNTVSGDLKRTSRLMILPSIEDLWKTVYSPITDVEHYPQSNEKHANIHQSDTTDINNSCNSNNNLTPQTFGCEQANTNTRNTYENDLNFHLKNLADAEVNFSKMKECEEMGFLGGVEKSCGVTRNLGIQSSRDKVRWIFFLLMW